MAKTPHGPRAGTPNGALPPSRRSHLLPTKEVGATRWGSKVGAVLLLAGGVVVILLCFTSAPQSKTADDDSAPSQASAGDPSAASEQRSAPWSTNFNADSAVTAPAHTKATPLMATPIATPGAEPELTLPPPPSGDYELALTTEQLAKVIERRYGSFLSRLNLSTERMAQLRALLAERQQITIDAANAAVINGADPVRDVAVIVAATREVQTGMDATLRDAFGETVFAAYREAEHRLPAENSVRELARSLANSPEPLTPEQTARLLPLFRSGARISSADDVTRAIYGNVAARAQISPSAVKTAANILSRGQLGALESLNLLEKERAR